MRKLTLHEDLFSKTLIQNILAIKHLKSVFNAWYSPIEIIVPF